MGEMDAARTAFGQAAKAANDFPGKEEVRRRLALLEGVEGNAAELVKKLCAKRTAARYLRAAPQPVEEVNSC